MIGKSICYRWRWFVIPLVSMFVFGYGDQQAYSGLFDKAVKGVLSNDVALFNKALEGASKVMDHGIQQPADKGQTEAEKRMREQSKNFDKTVWEGALAGAVLGAAVGYAAGKDAKGAAIGAGAGALIGVGAGKVVANKQKTYADTEKQLNDMIKYVRDSNKEADEFITSVQEVLKEDKRKLAALNKKYEKGLIKQEELNKEKQHIKENQAVVEKAAKGAKEKLKKLENEKNKFEKNNPKVDSKKLASGLKDFRGRVEKLDKLIKAFPVA